ncbi:MAG: hypothetical protein ACHQJ4_00030 [Ignavibacteria bacterium]
MKIKTIFFITFIIFFVNYLNAQNNNNAGDIQRDALKKIEFLTGNWKGTEWILTPDDMKRNVESTDIAEFKLNGTVILFQGTVKVKMPGSSDPVTVYEGIGLLSYDENIQKYRLQHFGSDGSYADYECILTDKTLVCESKDTKNIITRVTIGLDDSGFWKEKGERSEDGTTWNQYFETRMEKIPADSK